MNLSIMPTKKSYDMTTKPDRWVILKLKNEDETLYKVLAGWSGSYLYGDSWKLNSGIVKVEHTTDDYLFHGYSGSVYQCSKRSYGMIGIMISIVEQLKQQFGENNVTILEENKLYELAYKEVI